MKLISGEASLLKLKKRAEIKPGTGFKVWPVRGPHTVAQTKAMHQKFDTPLGVFKGEGAQ